MFNKKKEVPSPNVEQDFTITEYDRLQIEILRNKCVAYVAYATDEILEIIREQMGTQYEQTVMVLKEKDADGKFKQTYFRISRLQHNTLVEHLRKKP